MGAAAVALADRVSLPDAVTRAAIGFLVGRTDRSLQALDSAATAEFARDMRAFAIAEHPEAANAQHYEVPAAFFHQVLGPNLKYSCCYYGNGDSLGQAEERALALTAEHADLADGQRILELGCGWGSLSLWMASQFPQARITAVSNSASQRAFIEEAARRRGLTNLRVITADINEFGPEQSYDRIVSVEMFEHLANWPTILARVRGWLAPGGRLFLHVFSHETAPYRFDHGDHADFIAQHFFTGGIMPSHGLIAQFRDIFEVDAEWRWSGRHYEQTARDWLANYDARQDAILPVLRSAYGDDAAIWQRRWRLFFLATAGLFGHRDGKPWGVSHYRLRPA